MEMLYIVRHGIAVPHETPGYTDDERPLTSKGEKRVAQVAKGLRRLGLVVDGILTSPLPRALRTAELLADGLGLAAHLSTSDQLRADRTARTIKKWLGERPEARLMIVGHNPWCTELVSLLTTPGRGHLAFEMAKGGAAALSLSESAGWRLEWAATPGILRRLR